MHLGSDQQKLQLNIQVICAGRGTLTSVLRYKTASPKAPLPKVLILVYGSSDALGSIKVSSAIGKILPAILHFDSNPEQIIIIALPFPS